MKSRRRRFPRPYKPRPAPDEPGTLRQQFEIILLYGENPWRVADLARRWQMARRTVLQHARVKE